MQQVNASSCSDSRRLIRVLGQHTTFNMHYFLQPCSRGVQPVTLGSLFVEANKPSRITIHTFYHIAIILYTHVCVFVAFVCFAMLFHSSLLQDFAARRSQTDEKVSQRDEWYPKIPCRSEDQQEQSVDSFQLAKT
jgi:hypothetical protein